MYFPRPQERIPAPQAAPGGGAPQASPAGAPTAPQQAPIPIPNVSGFSNPQTGQQNNFAPIPPDEVKKWAELNHVSKGSIKQVEWSQNTGQYLMTMKDGDIQKLDPSFIMQNQGHWAPHPDHAQAAVHFIAGRQMRTQLPQILAALRARQGAGGTAGPGAPTGVPPTPMTPMANAATQQGPAPISGL